MVAKRRKLNKLLTGSVNSRRLKVEIPAGYPIVKDMYYVFICTKKKSKGRISVTGDADLIIPLNIDTRKETTSASPHRSRQSRRPRQNT